MATTKTTKRTPKTVKRVTKTTKKPSKAPEKDVALDTFEEETAEQRQAKIDAYTSLRMANVPIPKELADEVEGWIAAEEKRRKEEQEAYEERQKKVEEANAEGPWYVRNAYRGPFSLRLERQDKKRRIELKARGQRGDMFPLEDGDLKDPILQANLETGLIELVPAGDAAEIVRKQVTNLQKRDHVPLALLRNEKGEPYAPENIRVEAEFNQQGVTVAYLDPKIGEQHENIKWQSNKANGLIRAKDGRPEEIAQFVPTGGNPAIISNGFAQRGLAGTSNAQAMIADDLARRKTQGPAAGLGGLSVSVDPVQRT